MNKITYRSLSGACALVAAATVLAATTTSSAGIVSLVSDDASSAGLGTFTGWLEYSPDLFSSTATLSVNLTNTSDLGNGGYLTGFVFNLNSTDPGATVSLLSASHDFQLVAGENAAPFGIFDAGAAVGGNWLGGGAPQAGIAVGESGVFEFLIAANDVGTLTSQQILGVGENFLVRFRGFEDGGSDKVPAIPASGIPAPAALSLLLVAAAATGRRRRD